MARRKGWRAVKKHLNYTIDEAARNQCVSKGSVLRWLKRGLPCLNDARPFLILGRDLIDFLKALNPPKHPLKPDEFYCFTCKVPRKPAFGEVEYTPVNTTGGKLIALCCDCSTVLHKTASLAILDALKPVARVLFPQGHEPLSDGAKPL
jgi:hypothetical protein